MNNPNKLSELLLFTVKMKEATQPLRSQLENMTMEELLSFVDTDEKKKAFWINVYNAFFQILKTEMKLGKPAIFKNKVIPIGGENFSLDNIEHCILRKLKFKGTFGLFSSPFAPKSLKRLAVNKLDYRIHFALNCGAESCPPIAFYNDKKIDAQLDLATQSFLESESVIVDEDKLIRTTSLFKWFSADFGGPRGIRKIYKKQMNKDISGYKIYYNDYSWEEKLDYFIS